MINDLVGIKTGLIRKSYHYTVGYIIILRDHDSITVNKTNI